MFDLKKIFLDFLFPPECVGCQKEGDWLCSDCFFQIKIDQISFFEMSDQNNIFQVGYLSDYRDIWEKMIINFKYQFIKDLAINIEKIFQDVLSDEKARNFFSEDWVLVPIPLAKKRQAWRGFNQSEVIAEIISKYTGLKVAKNFLTREINTRPQVGLNQKERKNNLKGAFRANPGQKLGRVILIDDVITTGSTISEAARELRKTGIISIKAFVLAKG